MNIDKTLKKINKVVKLSPADKEAIRAILSEESKSTVYRNAAKFLCEISENYSIEEQVELIRNHPNGLDFIDNVEGVDVWDTVAMTFTCDGFIDLIEN